MCDLYLNDMKMLKKLNDISAERGALRGEELLTVGNLRTKIVNIITSVEERLEREKEEDKNPKDE